MLSVAHEKRTHMPHPALRPTHESGQHVNRIGSDATLSNPQVSAPGRSLNTGRLKVQCVTRGD